MLIRYTLYELEVMQIMWEAEAWKSLPQPPNAIIAFF